MHLFLKKIYRKNPFPKIYRINQCEVLNVLNTKRKHQLIVKLFKLLLLYCFLYLAILTSLGAQSNSPNAPIANTEPTQFKPQDFNLTINSWNRQDGFPSWQIFNLFQDSRGILWIGAKQDLYSFDGYEFKDYGVQTLGED